MRALRGLLPSWLKALFEPEVVFWLGLAMGCLGLVSLLGLPLLLARIPADYFTRPSSPLGRGGAALFWRIGRNLLGALLVLLGIAMLVLPGQGLLTILAGLMFAEFPGKRRLERWLVLRPKVLGVVNGLRARAGRAPLEVEPRVSSE